MHAALCLCGQLPVLQLDTQLVLVMHCREQKKPTATGPLALSMLPNSELRVHGVRERPLDLRSLFDRGRRVLLLYPSEGAVPLDVWSARWKAERSDSVQGVEKTVASNRAAGSVTLVVPDGNWRQASRAAKRIPGLERAERVTLPPGPATRWGMRQETKDGGLATFEAIARALGFLEGSEVREKMEAFFLECVHRQRGVREGSIALDRLAPTAPTQNGSTTRGAEVAPRAEDHVPAGREGGSAG